MTGVSSAPRSSSSTPSVRESGIRRRRLGRAGHGILGASVAIAAFAAAACQSELGDGNASMDPNGVPGFTGIPGPGGNVQPGGNPGGINAPGGDGVTNPGDVMN